MIFFSLLCITIFRKWTNDGRIESVQFAGKVLSIATNSPKVTLAATDTSDINQIMIYDKETLRNPDSGKILNVNEGKVRSHWDEKGADIWEFVYSGNDGGSNSFGRLLYDNIIPKGAWPFDCDSIISCSEFEGQSCGCSNMDGSNEKAIVYFLGTGSKMRDKLDFKTCQDLQDNGNTLEGKYMIDGTETYCQNQWSKYSHA